MALVKWENGEILQQAETKAAAQVAVGNYDHYQVHPNDDAVLCARINADLRAVGSTERIGPAPDGSNDPARYREIRTVVYSRRVDDEGRIYWALVPSI